MKSSLELWVNKVYKREVNENVLTTNTSPHFYKQALKGRCYFSGIGFNGSAYLGLACSLKVNPNYSEGEL